MRVLCLSSNFPPEVNAPAARLYEHARRWVDARNAVTVVAPPPNFPEGRVYPPYRNRFLREEPEGIEVYRVPVFIAENKGTIRRTLGYMSFMLSALIMFPFTGCRPDVVVGSSPHMFTAVAAWLIARMRGVPFVLEVRDLWPASVVAVGKMRRNAIIRAFERLERRLYRAADHIVVLTDAFAEHIAALGEPRTKMTTLQNGVDLTRFTPPSPEVVAAERTRRGLAGKFVATYVGTVGMAHGIDIMYEAAKRCTDPGIVFQVVGTGAERAKLEQVTTQAPLANFRLIDKQPKEAVPSILAASDVAVVHLRDVPLFRTVLPSKLFEAMAMERPVLLGVDGESRSLLDRAKAGVCFPPEDADALVARVLELRAEPSRCAQLGRNGRAWVQAHNDRRVIADQYWCLLEQVARRVPVTI